MTDLILPPLRRTERDALKFARAVHFGQMDKAGNPYTTHLSRVYDRLCGLAAGCPFWSDEEVDGAQQIAWLHDTIEDTAVTLNQLRTEGFGRPVIDGVIYVTKPSGCLRYHDWIKHICMIGSLAAILVKLADVEDNSDPSRLALLDEPTRERLTKKYAGAADLLREAARKKGWQG